MSAVALPTHCNAFNHTIKMDNYVLETFNGDQLIKNAFFAKKNINESSFLVLQSKALKGNASMHRLICHENNFLSILQIRSITLSNS